MLDAGSLRQKTEIVQGVVNKLYPFKSLILLVCPSQILEFDTREGIKLLVNQKGAAIMFFESQAEANSSRADMVSKLGVYKEILAEATGNTEKSLGIINYCLDLLGSVVFMKIFYG